MVEKSVSSACSVTYESVVLSVAQILTKIMGRRLKAPVDWPFSVQN
jgi:hypothetical protein